jgi:hypothetical protein
LFLLGYDEKQEVNDGASIDTTVAGNLEEIIDIEVTRIAVER